MNEQEIPLTGGNLTPVVRVGNTVRRVTNFWSVTVHDLLRYLEVKGFDAAPRFLGFDEQGREILSYIKGEVGFMPYIWDEAVLIEVARLLRRFHDLTADYVPPEDAKWQFEFFGPEQYEVICHNDFAPYNLVFVDQKPHAILDFDIAAPGPRIWDVAFAAYQFVPLSYAPERRELGLANPVEQSRRLQLFCDSYGIEQPRQVLKMVERRLEVFCQSLLDKANSGDPAYQKMVAEGHLAYYQDELAALRAHFPEIERHLK